MESVVLINPFEVPADVDDARFLAGWEAAADYLRAQPGFLAARLHRAVSPNARFRFVNVAEWRSPQEFQAAVTSEGFRALANGTPPNYPSLYEVVRAIDADDAGRGAA